MINLFPCCSSQEAAGLHYAVVPFDFVGGLGAGALIHPRFRVCFHIFDSVIISNQKIKKHLEVNF